MPKLFLIIFTMFSLMTGLFANKVDASVKRPLFAFDNGLEKIESFDEKARVLKKLGYSGISWTVGARADEM